MSTLSFSVVIPCYNEENYIGDLLRDIIHQSLQPEQVIVADSQSTDKTLAVVQSFTGTLPLSITTSKLRTPGAARNAGARLAKGEYIIFIDADCRLPVTTFEQLMEATRQGKIDYVSPLFTTPGNHIIDRLVVMRINSWLQKPSTPQKLTPGVGMLMCVRRASHEAINGFDDMLHKENDMEYLERLRQLGTSYAIVSELVVETSNRRLIKDGRFVSVLNFTPRNSWLGKRIVYPFLARIGKDKRYGIF